MDHSAAECAKVSSATNCASQKAILDVEGQAIAESDSESRFLPGNRSFSSQADSERNVGWAQTAARDVARRQVPGHNKVAPNLNESHARAADAARRIIGNIEREHERGGGAARANNVLAGVKITGQI